MIWSLISYFVEIVWTIIYEALNCVFFFLFQYFYTTPNPCSATTNDKGDFWRSKHFLRKKRKWWNGIKRCVSSWREKRYVGKRTPSWPINNLSLQKEVTDSNFPIIFTVWGSTPPLTPTPRESQPSLPPESTSPPFASLPNSACLRVTSEING